ncbi:MAG: hypothetical protein LUF78_02265 [Clostridiales bacterium]|nr:hypothetical protein [Clostridiales bacterium]MCD8153514.1 hypothetical protein [Clostridiales bacterium]
MTQEEYNRIMERMAEGGEGTEDEFFELLLKYPQYARDYVERYEKKLEKKKKRPAWIEKSPAEMEEGWRKIRERIEEDTGEATIQYRGRKEYEEK